METRTNLACLHNHTTDSNRDSVMSHESLVDAAIAAGYTALAKTEHGTVIGYNTFYELCKEKGIKPILGVEAYVTCDFNSNDRHHMILMAKNNDGWKAISKAVTESNEHVTKVSTLTFPLMDKNIIRKWFGRGSIGYGNVIATSACVSGVVAGIWFHEQRADDKLAKLIKKRDKFTSESDTQFLKLKDAFEGLQSEVKDLQVKIAEAKKLANRSTMALERRASSGKTEEIREKARNELSSINAAKEQAKKDLDEFTKLKEEKDAQLKNTRTLYGKEKISVEKWKALEDQVKAAETEKKSDEDCKSEMVREAAWFRDTFAPSDFYMELQFHGMKEEKYVMPVLAEIAGDLNIPVVAANDAHIPTNSGDDILARQIIRSTRFDKWEDATAADKEMYVKTPEELTEALSKILPEDIVAEAMENTGKIAEQCNVELKKENHYPKFKTPNGETPEEYLTKMAYAGIRKRYGKDWDEKHEERLKHELSVICGMGYADYHLIVQDFLEYAREAGKLDLTNPEEAALARTFDLEKIRAVTKSRPGECVGPGRGSAAGSIVCYLIGITNIDPIRYNLLFERFLNPERVSMPDIDCDIESTVRPFVVEYVKHKYGESSVCGIMTQGTQSGKAAIQTAARVLGLKRKEDSTAYLSLGDALSKKAAASTDDELHLKLSDVEKDVLTAFSDNEPAKEIFRYAKLIEGCVTQIGQHAAGIIIADGHPVSDYVPLCWNDKNKIMTTQVDMIAAEAMGLLKMDFLGLNNLTIITETLKIIKKRTGDVINMDKIPFENEVFENIFASAMTNSIFQFESAGMKNMLKQFKPGSIDDLVLLVAMFRPGPLQFLPDVIKVKQGVKEIEYLTPELRPILGNTYGSIVYQEQVQQIFRDLAGYSLGQADIVRRAMSKKKLKVIEAERDSFLHGDPKRGIHGCVAAGIDEDAANTLFDQMTDFAAYAFNRSHAACYAVVAYQTAWLKYHYPSEYMTAVFNNSKFEKFQGLVADLKELGVEIAPPDVNASELKFTLSDDGKILFGLGAIKGLGNSVFSIIKERENGEFNSLSDFVMRTLPGKAILEELTWSGAFDRFIANRKQLSEAIPDYLAAIKKVKDAEKKLQTESEKSKKENRAEKAKAAYALIREVHLNNGICDDPKETLNKEHDLLGAYIGKQPIDLYKIEDATDKISYCLENVPKHCKIAGIISDLRVKARKSDGAPLAFFKLTDKSGTIDVACFTNQYAKYNDVIIDGEVVVLDGHLDKHDDDIQFITKAVTVPELNIPPIVVAVHDIADWMERVRPLAAINTAEDGHPLIIYDEMMDEFRSTTMRVTEVILTDKRLKARSMG